MATKVYGCSDDLIEVDGEVRGEVSFYSRDDRNGQGCLLTFSDGTMLEVKYGKGEQGIWAINIVNIGDCFDRIDPCTDSEADPYSDVAHFGPGLKFVYAATEWECIR